MPDRLQELIDIGRLQSFIDSFSGVSGIPTAIIGRNGAIIASAGWGDLCLDFHRASPESLKCCLESTDRVVAEVEKGCGIARHICPHGFIKAAFPLVVDCEWLATMVTGQMLPGVADEERFRAQARRYGFDEAAYLAALKTIPVLTPEQLERNLTCLQSLTDLIVDMATAGRRDRASTADIQGLAERYASILDTTADGFWIIDGRGRCLEVNDVCAANLGYTREELLGMSLRDIDAGESAMETAARIQQIKRDGFGRFEVVHRRKDGSLMDVEVSTSYIADEDLFITFLRDISGAKRAAEALRLSEKRFRDLFEHAPVPYQSLDIDGKLLEVNDAWCRMMGYERAEVIGCGMEKFLAEYARPLLQDRMALLARDGSMTGVACQLRRKDGSMVDVVVEGSTGRDSEGRFARSHCILIDVTEQKRAEEALRLSQQQYLQLVEGTDDLVTSVDDKGCFTFVNGKARDIFGMPVGDCIGRLAFDFVHPEDRQATMDWFSGVVGARTEVATVENRQVSLDGSVRTILWTCTFNYDGMGTVRKVDGIGRDITERKRAEEEVLRLNEDLEERVRERTAELQASNRELESFCYSISHDLRAPLRAIDGYTSILQEDYLPLLDEPGADLCRRIGNNAIRMGSLIDDLLTFSRVGRASFSLERLDMTALARRAFEEMVPEEERGRIDFRQENLPPARADETAMGQVWANLLGNAVKYTSREPRAVITVSGRQEGDSLVYCIQDNGVGFDMAYSNKLFGVFLRAHSPSEFPGTGVGLAIVERIVHRHGGKVWAAGEEGKGATFCFSLPR